MGRRGIPKPRPDAKPRSRTLTVGSGERYLRTEQQLTSADATLVLCASKTLAPATSNEGEVTIKPNHFPSDGRTVLRAVALAYRRTYRAIEDFREGHQVGLDAAEAEYRRLVPDAPADPLEVSRIVNAMIAAAINADAKWYWYGPDV